MVSEKEKEGEVVSEKEKERGIVREKEKSECRFRNGTGESRSNFSRKIFIHSSLMLFLKA